MSHTHGTVIVCERVDGATHAWVDDLLSLEVPAGYFVEVWMMQGEVHIASVGDMVSGYQNALPTYGEAVQWCWRDARRWGRVA